MQDGPRMPERDGWYQVRMRGSYQQFKHSTKRELITLPGCLGDDLAIGTLNSILKKAELKE